MTVPSVNCAKCNSRMEDGILLDRGHGYIYAASWVAGPVDKSWLTGMRLKGKSTLDVRTYRCTACGYLESYAK